MKGPERVRTGGAVFDLLRAAAAHFCVLLFFYTPTTTNKPFHFTVLGRRGAPHGTPYCHNDRAAAAAALSPLAVWVGA